MRLIPNGLDCDVYIPFIHLWGERRKGCPYSMLKGWGGKGSGYHPYCAHPLILTVLEKLYGVLAIEKGKPLERCPKEKVGG